jgi:saccharopine dehydrogenase-like NADP-dependent oxidoreductase
VLLVGLNNARYRRDGREVRVPGRELFDHQWQVPVEVEGKTISFIGYPNRDSLPYTEYYGIDPSDTMFRGTLRFPHWCATMKQIARLGWLATDAVDGLDGQSFADLTPACRGSPRARRVAPGSASTTGTGDFTMEWIGLFSGDPLPGQAPVDICAGCWKMSYAEGERDMLVLQHTFVARYPDRRERITSTMVDFGIPGGDSSMNRTVGLPAAVGVRFILEGRFTRTGVIVPVMPEFYEPALAELERLGIQFAESSEVIG